MAFLDFFRNLFTERDEDMAEYNRRSQLGGLADDEYEPEDSRRSE